MAFSPDGSLIATAGVEDTARVWNPHDGTLVRRLEHDDTVHWVGFSPDGKMVLTTSADGTAHLWDPRSGRRFEPPLKHGRYVHHAAFSPDGRRLGTAGDDGTAVVWELIHGRAARLHSLKHGHQDVRHIAFNRDGRLLVTACGRQAQIWDTATGIEMGPPLEHDKPVQQATFSPDGHLVLTASDDQTAQVWDAYSGKRISPALRHNEAVVQAGFSRDSRWVVTASHDGSARAWEAMTGQPVSPRLRHADKVWHAAFCPDGRRVVTAGDDGKAIIWNIEPDSRPAEDLVQIAQLLTGQQVDSGQAARSIPPATLADMWHSLRAKHPRDFAWSVTVRWTPKNWTTMNVIKPGGQKPMAKSTRHGSGWSRVRL